MYAIILVFSFVKKPEKAATPGSPIAPSTDFVNVCFFVTLVVFSILTVYIIAATAVLLDIPLWSANIILLELADIAPVVIPVGDAVTLNCPDEGVPLVIPVS